MQVRGGGEVGERVQSLGFVGLPTRLPCYGILAGDLLSVCLKGLLGGLNEIRHIGV